MATVRENDLSASMEDYLEVIYNLAAESNVARSKDIAESLKVSRASVTGALRVLKDKGLANYKPYGYVTLTDNGKAAAVAVVRKHNVLKSFFADVLGVDDDIAQQAACKAEHTLGPNVIGKLLAFIEFVTRENKNGYDMATKFRKFCSRKKK